jgi:hypothetical protein
VATARRFARLARVGGGINCCELGEGFFAAFGIILLSSSLVNFHTA